MATSQMAYSRAISTWFHARLGAALAFGMCGSAVGAMILPPIAQRLIDALGWRQAAVTLGIAILAIGLPTVLALRPRAARHAHRRRPRPPWPAPRSAKACATTSSGSS